MSDVPPPQQQPVEQPPPAQQPPPPVPAEAQDAVAARDRAENTLRNLLIAALILYVVTHDGGEDKRKTRRFQDAAASASGVLISGLQHTARRLSPRGKAVPPEIDIPHELLAGSLAEEARKEAQTHVAELTREPLSAAELQTRARAIASGWAQTEATKLWSQTTMNMAEAIAAQEKTPMSKLWLSRGDSKVRPLHRHLHAESRELGRAFWRWPSTGKELRFPGDPEAPLDQTINCRCVLFLVPTAETPKVPAAFAIPAEHFVP